jgi:hypothetical protein
VAGEASPRQAVAALRLHEWAVAAALVSALLLRK